MTKTGWIVVAGIIILLAGGAWLLSSSSSSGPATTDNTMPANTGAQPGAADTGLAPGTDTSTSTTATAPMTTTVTYDGNSFTPSTVTIAQGGTVTFTDTAGQMWLASDPHPSHTVYDGTSRSQHCEAGYTGAKPLDECGTGSSFSFTFDKVGSWGYHDHLNDGAHGTVTVVAAQ